MNDIQELAAKVADHAAVQSDRWLFVFVFMFLLATFAIFFRWLLKDRESIAKRLTEVTDRHIEQCAKLTEVVTWNSRVVDNNTNALREFSERVRDCGVINRQH